MLRHEAQEYHIVTFFEEEYKTQLVDFITAIFVCLVLFLTSETSQKYYLGF